ncbi:hypothetical protein ALQ29_05613 [Pseudomonas marginalis pv. marginalis]|uniref:Uncharacterized protein n=1 Tax=Pseudomonas marginalis pv. marginalis TaxID=97473 RepID=A0A3M3ZYC6_PSEMA|nr:hypothetical protein ALQ38_05539 [Pseudomonas marginalis pv. marginalis]RMO99648.1 hypothetical protein ALQ29_05613 [Pseudomonas marginalis pv. marginalis]
MIRRGGRHIPPAHRSLGIQAFMPAFGMQEALLQRQQLALQHRFAVRPQGQCPQVLSLGPDALGAVAHRAVQRQHAADRTAGVIHTLKLCVGKGPCQRSMQRRTAQYRRRLQQEEPLELVPRLEPVIHRAQRFFHHYAVLAVDEALLHGRRQRQQGCLHLGVFTHGEGGEEAFGQMHQGILQRAGIEGRPIAFQHGFVKTVAGGKPLGDDFQGSIEHRLHQRFAHLGPVVGTGKDDERMGVEVFALVQRLAGRVDAVEPAAVLGVVEVPLQRAEQRRGAFFGKRRIGLADQAGEQVQLPGAGHGAVALWGQWLVIGVQRLIGQCQVGIPAGALPERHDQTVEVR